MPKTVQNPLSNYHLFFGEIDLNVSRPIRFPVPRSAFLRKITLIATVQQLTAAATPNFFKTSGVQLAPAEGVAPVGLSIPSGNAPGDVYVVELDHISGLNHFTSTVNADAGTNESYIECRSGGGAGTAGFANLIVTFGR